MNPTPNPTPHRVYLVDLEEPIIGMLAIVGDYMEHDNMFTARDVLMMAMNFLIVSHNVDEAAEAMEIDLMAVCRVPETPYNIERLRLEIKSYLNALHRQFLELNFYGEDAQLKYDFGGFHDDYTPIFVPSTHIQHYPAAISHEVVSEPYGKHPNRVFYPLNERDDFEARNEEREYKIVKTFKS